VGIGIRSWTTTPDGGPQTVIAGTIRLIGDPVGGEISDGEGICLPGFDFGSARSEADFGRCPRYGSRAAAIRRNFKFIELALEGRPKIRAPASRWVHARLLDIGQKLDKVRDRERENVSCGLY
jgi:hypothetical protein